MVELASLIAEEKFSDRPRCVCPVIGAFLRGWNDRAPHAKRQRLRPYAERIVGSREDARVTRERRDVCLEWAGADLSRGATGRFWSRTGVRIRIAVFCGLRGAVRLNEGAGDYAARVAWARRNSESAFELLDRLLAIGEHPPPERPPAPALNGNGNGNGHRHLNGNAPALGPISRGAESRPERPPERSESEEPSRART